MTYWGFHLRFNLPVLLVVGVAAGPDFWSPGGLLTATMILAIVMLFTSPWDNWAAKCGIWGFAEGRYWRKIKYLPVEEYAFFVIQSLQAMGLTALALKWMGPFVTPLHPWSLSGQAWALGIMGLVWMGIGLWGRHRVDVKSSGHYAWHLLFWFLPVIAAQWIIGAPILAERWSVWLAVTVVLGTYLSVADWIAIRAGIWFFDEHQTTGHKIGGVMPWEEAAFFYLTSLLVAQSYLILAPESIRS